jgi:uncharacterized protein YycO
MKLSLVLVIQACLALGVAADTGKFQFQNGDIIFQETRSGQSEAIKRATNSKYSHVGIIYIQRGRPVVFEAVQPVKISAIQAFIGRSVGGHYVVKRLKNRDSYLTTAVLRKTEAEGRKYVGKNYDWGFGWSDTSIYCSEQVWKIYKRGAGIELAATKYLKNFDLTDAVVKAKMKERYGNRIPYDEPVVAPSQLFDSELLETVFEK